MAKPRNYNVKVISGKPNKIAKAEMPVSITDEADNLVSSTQIQKPYDPNLLELYVRESSILPQCIRAYQMNIAGFGYGVQQTQYFKELLSEIPETDEVRRNGLLAQYELQRKQLQVIIQRLSLNYKLKQVFDEIIRDRETYGYMFLECVPDLQGNIREIKVVDANTVTAYSKDEDFFTYNVYINGERLEARKRFRRYRQLVNGRSIFFKEFGDPRIMDYRTGEYRDDVTLEFQANPLYHIKIGYTVYGTPRWEGNIVSTDGSTKAEMLNHSYFTNGRHLPLAIVLENGQLSAQSNAMLTEYSEQISGEAGRHKFLLLEVQPLEQKVDFEDGERSAVRIERLADTLQKDELFQEYLDNARKKIQSSFNLPDVYLAYTTDFNRATAEEARRITEEQVFITERGDLAGHISRILNSYNLPYAEFYFKSPVSDNTELVTETLGRVSSAMTPNQLLREYFQVKGEEYTASEESWADVPGYVYPLIAGGFEGTEILNADTKNMSALNSYLRAVKKSLEESLKNEYP